MENGDKPFSQAFYQALNMMNQEGYEPIDCSALDFSVIENVFSFIAMSVSNQFVQ